MSPKLTDDFKDFIKLLYRYDVDFLICGNQIDLMTSMSSQDIEENFLNKAEGQLEEFKVFFVGYEDLLRAKREANRLKDQLDLEELQAINGN